MSLFLEDEFLDMVPLQDLDALSGRKPTHYPSDLRHADRQAVDRAVLKLIGVPNSEIQSLLDRLYVETTLLYRHGRILDIRSAANKRSSKKGVSATAHEIAESLLESTPTGALMSYPRDFMQDSEPIDHHTLPDGHAKLREDMFHGPRLAFKTGDIEFRNREQAELALTLHESSLRGTIPLPANQERCRELRGRWITYFDTLKRRFEEEAAQRTPDERQRPP